MTTNSPSSNPSPANILAEVIQEQQDHEARLLAEEEETPYLSDYDASAGPEEDYGDYDEEPLSPEISARIATALDAARGLTRLTKTMKTIRNFKVSAEQLETYPQKHLVIVASEIQETIDKLFLLKEQYEAQAKKHQEVVE